jgi:DNA-binding CsgD family transcriptional regulator
VGLTAKELEVVRLMASGASDTDIARELFISPRTAGWHVGNIIAKLCANNRAHAVVIAVWRGSIPLAQLPEIVNWIPPMARKKES